RQHAVLRRPLLDRGEHLFEALTGDERRVGTHEARRRLAECSRFALICDLHAVNSPPQRTQGPPCPLWWSVSSVSSYVKKGHHPPADDGPWYRPSRGLSHPLTLVSSTTTKGITSRTHTSTARTTERTVAGTRVISVGLLQPVGGAASN